MDEPLGALDKKLRESLQLEISRIRRQLGITVIYVTHDQEEALAMSDRIAIYNRGQIDQIGSPEDLYRRPKSLFTARFMGESTVFEGELARADHGPMVIGAVGPMRVSQDACDRNSVGVGDKVVVVVRPEHMNMWLRSRVTDTPPGADWAATIEGVIQDAVFRGPSLKYVVRCPSGEVVTVYEDSSARTQHRTGDEVVVAWRVEDAAVVASDR
jgi:putative spermidine/putrescine transport system ATP-binding protein